MWGKNIMQSTEHSAFVGLRDPMLSIIVSKAAMEFDKASKGILGDFNNAKQLAGFLSESISINMDFENPLLTKSFDSDMLNLMVGVKGVLNDKGDVKNTNDVLRRASEIVNEMKIDGECDYNLLREFCVALGKSLLSYRALYENYRPYNTYEM